MLLQGWLENCIAFTSQNETHGDRHLLLHWISLGPGPNRIVIAEQGEQAVAKADELDEQRSVAEEVEQSPIEAAYRAPQAESQVAAAHPSQKLAIVVSSVVFALLHYEHGPDWIPLLLLAGGLGYLYQRTHRILPCIVVHFLVNSVSFCILLIGVFDPPKL
jgi:hypothetical protein